MPTIVPVEDAADPRLADYVGLKDPAARRGHEGAEAGLFIAEGPLVLGRLLVSPYRVRSVLVTPQRLPGLAADLAGLDVPVYLASQQVMNAVAGFDIHRGVLASADRRPLAAVAEVLAGATRVAVLENITDHENLGVILRNAAAFGVDAVLLSPQCCDPFYRRCVRVSMGYALLVPMAVVHPWPGGLGELRAAGFRLVALSPDPAGADLRGLGLAAAGRVAYLLGEEGPGLSAAARAAADVLARIAMAPGVDSLNVAAAAAVAFYAGLPGPA